MSTKRVTQKVTRVWAHSKQVTNRETGEQSRVQVLEVSISPRILEQLKEAVRIAEARHETLKAQFGETAVREMSLRVADRSEPTPQELTRAMPKIQLWPGPREGEKDLSVYAEAMKNLPKTSEQPKPVLDATQSPEENLPDENEGGFEGLGSLFGNRNQGR